MPSYAGRSTATFGCLKEAEKVRSERSRRARKKIVPPPHGLLEYRSARAYNREVSMLKFAPAFHAFATMDETSERVSAILTKNRDRNGKTHVSLL